MKKQMNYTLAPGSEEAVNKKQGDKTDKGHVSILQMTEKQLCERECERLNARKGSDDGTGYACELCGNTGIVFEPHFENNHWTACSKPCECMEIRRVYRETEASGLKEYLTNCSFDNYETPFSWQEKLKASAMDYAENPQGWFFVGGQSGAGKTHLCAAIGRELIHKKMKVKYIQWQDVLKKWNKVGGNAEDDNEKFRNELMNCQVLIIDDLFINGEVRGLSGPRPKPWEIGIALDILCARAAKQDTYTVISTECTVDDLLNIRESLAGRIIDRAWNHLNSIARDRGKNNHLQTHTGEDKST